MKIAENCKSHLVNQRALNSRQLFHALDFQFTDVFRNTATGIHYMNGLFIDGVENVYVCGGYSNSLSFDTSSLSYPSYTMYLVSYNRNGTYRWAKSANNSRFSGAFSVASDACGNIQVSGEKTLRPSSSRACIPVSYTRQIITGIHKNSLSSGEQQQVTRYTDTICF